MRRRETCHNGEAILETGCFLERRGNPDLSGMLVKTPSLAGIIKENFYKAVNRFLVPFGGQ
jgi:hypothetical protein